MVQISSDRYIPLEHPISDIPKFINEFSDLINSQTLPQSHFLSPLLQTYYKWRAKSDWRTSRVPVEVLKLAMYAQDTMCFSEDWDRAKVRSYLVDRLRDPQHCAGYLFEFRTGIHFKMLFPKVIWLSPLGRASTPDIRVQTSNGITFSVECVCKRSRPERSLNLNLFKGEVSIAVRDKAEQHKQLEGALLIAVYVPEEFDWYDTTLRENLGARIQTLFTNEPLDPVMDAVSGLVLISGRDPEEDKTDRGRAAYNMSNPVIGYRNPNATFELKDDFIAPD